MTLFLPSTFLCRIMWFLVIWFVSLLAWLWNYYFQPFLFVWFTVLNFIFFLVLSDFFFLFISYLWFLKSFIEWKVKKYWQKRFAMYIGSSDYKQRFNLHVNFLVTRHWTDDSLGFKLMHVYNKQLLFTDWHVLTNGLLSKVDKRCVRMRWWMLKREIRIRW